MEALERAERFLPIPQLDPGAASTSWQTRDREISVDVLTPMRGRSDPGPKKIRALGVHATPLRYLDYLLEEVDQAAVLTRAGVLVRVPRSERFALHKLVVAQERGAGFRDRRGRTSSRRLSSSRFCWKIGRMTWPTRGRRWSREANLGELPCVGGGKRLPAELWRRVQATDEA